MLAFLENSIRIIRTSSISLCLNTPLRATINTIILKNKDMENSKRSKKAFQEMLPVKQFLSSSEARAFLDMGENNFRKIVDENNLSISVIGGKRYYKVNELQGLFTPVLK